MPYDLEAIEQKLKPPDKADLSDEALAFMGARITVNDAPVPLPTAGGLSLLEMIDSPYAIGGQAGPDSARAALFVFTLGEAALGVVQHAVLTPDPKALIQQAADEFCQSKGLSTPDAGEILDAQYRKQFGHAKTAFNFFPAKGGEGDDTPLVFGAEWLSAIVHAASLCGIPRRDALWEVPLVTIAFLRVQIARYEGAKNVDRSNTLDWSEALKELA